MSRQRKSPKKESKKSFISELASTKTDEERQELISENLSTSDAELKRRSKNDFLNLPIIIENFNDLKNALNKDQDANALSYLIKGSSAWHANFFKSNNRDRNVEEDISNNIAFLPQNWDIEVYCPENMIQNVILKYYNGLSGYQRLYSGDINEPEGELKILTRGKATKARKQYGIPEVDTCISISENITLINKDNKINNTCISSQTADRIILKNPFGMENLKAYSLSFCVKLKDYENKNIQTAWERYSDRTSCGSEKYHFIFYITFHKIPINRFTNFKQSFLNKITINIDNINYLNYDGLLLYATLIKANSGREFRTDKGMDLDTYRLEKLVNAITETNLKNITEEQKKYRSELIVNNYFKLYQLISTTFASDFWDNYIIPHEYWIGNLKQELVKRMLQNYYSDTIPSGIVQKIEDTMIEYYRPILNTIVKELYDNIKEISNKFPEYIFNVMIAGGDSFERYIPTGKIADIDLKIIIQKRDRKTLKSKQEKEKQNEVFKFVREVIYAILSKHIVLLNKMTEECGNDDNMFINALKQSKEEQFYNKDCTSNNSVFKLCPKYDGENKEIKTNFRLRNIPVFSSSVLSFNLVSIDMRKSFNVYYKDQEKPMSYKYDLAILDVPFKIYTDFKDDDIDLQDIVVSNIKVSEDCFINGENAIIPPIQYPPSELSLSVVARKEAPIVVERGRRGDLGRQAPTQIERMKHINLCDNPSIKQEIATDGICFFRSILYGMSQLRKDVITNLINKLNRYLEPDEKFSINEITYDIDNEMSKETIKTCAKIGLSMYTYLSGFLYDKETEKFKDDYINNVIFISEDYQDTYFSNKSKFLSDTIVIYENGIQNGDVKFSGRLHNNIPVDWPGSLEVYTLGKLLNVNIETMLINPMTSSNVVLYVCYNGINHYDGVRVLNLPYKFNKNGYKTYDNIYEENVEMKEENEEMKEENEEMKEFPYQVSYYRPSKQRVKNRYRPYPELRFSFDDEVKLPIASASFLIKDQEHMYDDKQQLLQRFFAGKINKDINRYKNLQKYISSKKGIQQKEKEKLNKFDNRYYQYAVKNESKINLEIKKEIYAYYIEALVQFKIEKLKSIVSRKFKFSEKYKDKKINDTINDHITKIKEFNIPNIVELIQTNEKFIDDIVDLQKIISNKVAFYFNNESNDDEDNIFQPDIITIDDIEYVY